ncbi:MAG: hypothetical protein O4749_04350 [Trichodesmium sp. St5_bin2_1]|nr:hypothetical protein [Trichodesmium sp. St5_bin2_1]MDE5120846.1 hypothetical protein [Trichodesmium sp. St19_bin1]
MRTFQHGEEGKTQAQDPVSGKSASPEPSSPLLTIAMGECLIGHLILSPE